MYYFKLKLSLESFKHKENWKLYGYILQIVQYLQMEDTKKQQSNIRNFLTQIQLLLRLTYIVFLNHNKPGSFLYFWHKNLVHIKKKNYKK